MSVKRVSLPTGESLAVWEMGRGAPILYVHGFPLNHSMWQPQLQGLCNQTLGIAPDLRGFGQSSVTSGTVSMEEHADDLATLLDALGYQEPVTLCGLSMGGYIAWQFWQRHRHRLARLILCDTRAAADSPEVARGRQLMAEEVLATGPSLAVDRLLPKLCWNQAAPEKVAELRDMILSTDPEGIAAAQRGMAARADMTDQLAHVDVPTLVLVGEHDGITPVSEVSEMASHMPQARLQVIPRAGHMAPWEQPDLVNTAIQQFLSESA